MYLHHVGQVVEEYDAALDLYRDVLGMAVVGTERVADHVRLAVLDAGNCQVHLIARDERRDTAGCTSLKNFAIPG